MSTTMTSDRGMMTSGMGSSGMMGMPMMGGMGMSSMMNGMMPSSSQMGGMMIPRCTMKMEKMAGGMKCTMMCEDKTAAEMMKSLCTMMQGGMVSMCCMMNGNDLLHLQHGHDGHVQNGNDGHGLHDDLHQRRPHVHENDSILLRLHDEHDDARLHLLHDDERHGRVLLHLLKHLLLAYIRQERALRCYIEGLFDLQFTPIDNGLT